MICIAKLPRVNAKTSPLVPDALPIAEALRRSEPLDLLRRQMHESNQRFAVVRLLLPTGLSDHVRPGPVDEEGWSLLAANAAVAAKLRQIKPRLEEALRDGGWQVSAIRIKVQPR
jgi:hypothetical protein